MQRSVGPEMGTKEPTHLAGYKPEVVVPYAQVSQLGKMLKRVEGLGQRALRVAQVWVVLQRQPPQCGQRAQHAGRGLEAAGAQHERCERGSQGLQRRKGVCVRVPQPGVAAEPKALQAAQGRHLLRQAGRAENNPCRLGDADVV